MPDVDNDCGCDGCDIVNDCGCRIVEVAGGQFEIEYCAVHELAPVLLKFLNDVGVLLEKAGSEIEDERLRRPLQQ